MKTIACALLAGGLASCAAASAQTAPASAYPTMAPVEKYLMPAATEIAMARSAGPASVSARAEVLVLTKNGYVVAAKGDNGWVCWVERMWTAGLDDPEFWNPKGHGPTCFNPPAVRSVLPQYLARTKWALEGDTREQIAKKARAAYADRQFSDPAPDSFAFMMSKQGYLNDQIKGPWHSHVMPFIAYDQVATWAAGFEGSPILVPPLSTFRRYEPLTIFIPVHRWSDGTVDP
ncbi:MAG TPA: hypothetical protein VMF61_15940 [Candidatus Acidoferrales bacterium]|nr:hypothetical protein [Candidatus Acidoferrales bacterium]